MSAKPRPGDLSDIEEDALAALASIVPTTREGAIALLRHLAEVEREANREFTGAGGSRRWFFHAAVENISRALDGDGYWTDPDDDPDPGEKHPSNDNLELAVAVAA